MTYRKYPIFLFILLSLSSFLYAESSLALDLQLMQTFYRGQDDEIHPMGLGTAGMTFRSTGNADVKADVQIDYIPLDASIAGQSLSHFDLKKVSVKVRFPSLRLTMGKTRVGWGDGQVFNAGDVLFGSLTPGVDLTADEARTETAWLNLVRWSPGRKTWFEAIYMPPSPQVQLDGSYVIPDLYHSSGGGRLVTEMGDVIVEAGYIYKGESKVSGDITGHRPYLSLHGDAFFDLYASMSLAIPEDQLSWEASRGSLNISLGMFRQFQIGYNGVLSFRLEALVFPYQHWEEQAVLANDGSEAYGLFFYPELNLAVGQNWNIPLMAVVSPIDGSAQVSAGFSWKVYQGFSFLGFYTHEMGDPDDLFAWDRTEGDMNFITDLSDGWSLMVGMKYTF